MPDNPQLPKDALPYDSDFNERIYLIMEKFSKNPSNANKYFEELKDEFDSRFIQERAAAKAEGAREALEEVLKIPVGDIELMGSEPMRNLQKEINNLLTNPSVKEE